MPEKINTGISKILKNWIATERYAPMELYTYQAARAARHQVQVYWVIRG